MQSDNLFPFSHTNKRYHTLDHFYKFKYQKKVYRITLETNFTCPNRDGSKGYHGCYFCSYQPDQMKEDVISQFERQKKHFLNKNPDALFLLYLQSGSTSYHSVEEIKNIISLIPNNDIVGIIFGTRPDVISDEFIEYLLLLKKTKDVYIELGLQTIHDSTASAFNRQYNFTTFVQAVSKLRKHQISITVHLMNGLPGESKEMMIETAKIVGKLDIQMIKFHCFSLLQGSYWENNDFSFLTQEEYVDIVVDQLKTIPPWIIIARLVSDFTKEELIAPLWTLDKIVILNAIDKKMAKEQIVQGEQLNFPDDFIHREILRLSSDFSHAIDATCGNGKDTLFLSNHFAKVTAIDIQEIAISRTKNKLDKDNVLLIREDFINIDKFILPATNIIIYNLGFLPGSDNKIKTTDKSPISIRNAINVLPSKAMIFITAYTRHYGGFEEYLSLVNLLKELGSNITYKIIDSISTFIIIKKI